MTIKTNLRGERFLIGLLLGTLACPSQGNTEGGNQPTSNSHGATMTQNIRPTTDAAKLDWQMTAVDGGKSLRIDYQVTNTTDKRIYLSDLLPVSGPRKWMLGDKVINVANDAAPDTVLFIRGRVASEAPLPRALDPGARSLDPGQTLTGRAEVPLPLRSFHYQGTAAPLRSKPAFGVLELGCIRGDAHWSELPMDDGTKLTLSHPADKMEFIRSDRKPIPSR